MKYSYNWLKELSGTKLSAEKMADSLMLHSFEIERIEGGEKFENVVVGEILEITKHPNADKLRIAKTDVGKETLQIVCGAPNIEVGQKVPVALVGAELPGGFKIKEAEIRGVKSFGMLCAEDELGLGIDHRGIMILDKKAKVGQSLSKFLGTDDTSIEIDVLANRGHDALSHVGMAREIAALAGRRFEYDYDGLNLPRKKTEKLSVQIKDKKLCPRYIGAVMEGITVKESPEWMKRRLEISGIRPINNVVDATNYVMLELGQPMHAFDFDKIATGGKAKIIVRRANEMEKIKLLDESEKELCDDDIVIADEKEAVALAGVMGGFDSGVSSSTETIVIESANFDASSIRRTRMRLGIISDAALRYEKDMDPNIAEKAMARIIEILEHTADAKLEGITDIYPHRANSWKVKLDLDQVDKLLGVRVPAGVVKKILTSLELKPVSSGKKITVTIPTFRIDLKTQEDLIEEIGRIYGYEKIKPAAPLIRLHAAKVNEKRIFARLVKDSLVSQGFSEVYNYSFYSQRDAGLAQLGSIRHLELENPANSDQALLRTSLIPNILKNVRENLKNFREFQIFEMGKVYWPARKATVEQIAQEIEEKEVKNSFGKMKKNIAASKLDDTALPEEKEMLVGALVLEKKSAKDEKQDKRHESGFFAAKSFIDGLFSRIGIADHYYDNFNNSPTDTPKSLWHESRSAEIKIEGRGDAVGYMGEINPLVLAQFDIHTRIVMFEFDMGKLFDFAEQERDFRLISKFPSVIRDVSMVADGSVRVDDILETIQSVGGDIVSDVDLFDAIDFSDGTTSFAFHVILGAEDRTLSGKEIEDAMNSIMDALEEKLKVKIRK